MDRASHDPRHEVVITGLGLVTPLGDDPVAVHTALCDGQHGVRTVTSFATDGLRVDQAAEIDFDHRHYFGRANVRPLDRTARLTTAAAQLALEASGWDAEARAAHDVGLVLGTMFGSVRTISAFDLRAQTAGPQYARPLDFANTVINAATGQVAIWHDLRGVNSTVTGGLTASAQAIAYAADLIRLGRADAVLAGGGEELCFESFHGYHQGGWLAGSRNGAAPCAVPLHNARNGFVLGEGAALLMLESAHRAAERNAPVLAHVRGWGSAFDPSRGAHADEATAALGRAVRTALDDAALDADAIDLVSLGANGHPTVDAHEAHGLIAALGDPGRTVPVAAIKSSLGECLGASAALQAATVLNAMAEGTVPGVRGLDDRDATLALDGARSTSRALAVDHGLITALGLDGNAAALVISR